MSDVLKNPWVVFTLALLGILGSWAIGSENWSVAFSTKGLGGLFIALASVTGASLSHSILGTRDPSPESIAAILTAYGVQNPIQVAPIAGTASAKATDSVNIASKATATSMGGT